jgi:hypothetical protein
LLHWDANGVPTDIALESSTILRLVLIVLHECRGDDLERDSPASLDYRIWRQIALETVIWGFRLLMLSRYEMSIDEEDLITTEIQRAKASWILHEELQSFETFAFDELLPSCVSPCIPHRVDQDCWQDELRRIVETMADRTSPISLTKGFWELHDLISEASILPRSYQGVKAGKQPVGTRDSSLRLILDAFKTSQIHHAETVAADIVKYHLRRLFRNLGISEDEVYVCGNVIMQIIFLETDWDGRSCKTLEFQKEYPGLWRLRSRSSVPLSWRPGITTPSVLGWKELMPGRLIALLVRTVPTSPIWILMDPLLARSCPRSLHREALMPIQAYQWTGLETERESIADLLCPRVKKKSMVVPRSIALLLLPAKIWYPPPT